MSDRKPPVLACGDTLLIATHNAGKMQEFAALLADAGITVVSATSHDLPEPEETADTFAGNAEIKARAAAEATGLPALADDSGFCVGALEGRPGVYSARWGGPMRDFDAAMARVHIEMGETSDRTAWFEADLCLAWPDGTVRHFTGRCDGAVCWPPRGTHGHGYDPIFVPDGESRSFAEMTGPEKNAISHRGRALAAFRAACLGD